MVASEHILVEGLSKVFPHRGRPLEALRRLDLRVGWGEFVSVIGPSGCGKSTLLRIVGGLLEPTVGQVHIDGRSPRDAQKDKDIGLVFQDPSLLPWRTVLGNVRLPLEVNRIDSHSAIRRGGVRKADRPRFQPQDLLELVGLGAFTDYRPHQLSGGMQQRVAIARALVFQPSLLLMDEPFGALDEITRSAMRYELLRVWQWPTGRPTLGPAGSERPKTVLFVTHSITEAVTLSDRVVVLTPRPGRVRAVIDIELPRPRDESIERSSRFLDYAQKLRNLLKEEPQ
jgi:NitT/TauT family transport system ATP-binding protein